MTFDTIRNFYEQLVYDYIQENFKREKDKEYLADIACVALNHLPPRYFRHEVDMLFYMSPVERLEMQQKIKQAVDHAVAFIKSRGKKRAS